MQKYVNQLLEQIEAIILKRWQHCIPHYYEAGMRGPYLEPPKGWNPDTPSSITKLTPTLDFQDSIQEMEHWLEGKAELSMFYHFELEEQLFPPPDRLTDEQLDQLCHALNRLWNAFNLTAVVPEEAPSRVVYPILLKRMLEPTMIMNAGHIGVEFCDYEPSQCVFKEYCSCKDDLSELEAFEQKEKITTCTQEEVEYEKKREELLAQLDPKEVAAIEKRIANMDRYVAQVLEDIHTSIKNLPTVYPWHKDHNLGEGTEWISELAFSPYKSIEDWTGILFEALPSEGDLTGEQIYQLVDGLDSLWYAYDFSFNIEQELKDKVIRYRMYLDCWYDLVQYLPQSGFEVELCYGNPNGCRMGEDCICLENPPDLSFDEPPIPLDGDLLDEDLPF